MATLPTLEGKARQVLQIFKHFGTRPGEALGQNNIVAVTAKNNWRGSDIADGLEYGLDNGWFEGGPNDSILLTKDGYAEI